jgi:hypothetical protein
MSLAFNADRAIPTQIARTAMNGWAGMATMPFQHVYN